MLALRIFPKASTHKMQKKLLLKHKYESLNNFILVQIDTVACFPGRSRTSPSAHFESLEPSGLPAFLLTCFCLT